MAIRNIQLSSEPSESSSLFANRAPQVWCGKELIHQESYLLDVSIVPPDTLRKYLCNMSTKSVRGRTFGQWLRWQLDRRDLRGADLARLLNTANGNVSRWLRDERVPSTESIERIADVLSLDIDTALTMAGHRPASIDLDPDSPTARLMPLIERVNWDAYPSRLDTLERELMWMIERDREAEKG